MPGPSKLQLACAIAAAAAAWSPLAVLGQAFPAKPVRMIIGFPAGSSSDVVGRLVAQKMSEGLGQQVIFENRPGAGGNIGAEVVFQSEGDGYTLLASSPTPLAINGWLYKKLNFDPAGFEPVAMMSRIPNVLVVPRIFPPSRCRRSSRSQKPIRGSSPSHHRGSAPPRISPASCS